MKKDKKKLKEIPVEVRIRSTDDHVIVYDPHRHAICCKGTSIYIYDRYGESETVLLKRYPDTEQTHEAYIGLVKKLSGFGDL